MKRSFKYILILIAGILLGILANRNKGYLINAQFIRDHLHFRKSVENPGELLKSSDLMVVLTFGQSNAGNYGDGDYVSKQEVYNYYKGDIYKAKEPLLGPDGGGASVWTRVGDLLIAKGLYKKVIIVPCAIGSTSVQCWSEGFCKEKLLKTLAYLKKDNIKLTHVFWDQGETDNVDGTTKEQYKKRLKEVINLIKEYDAEVPFFTTVSSYYPYGNNNSYGISQAVVTAQNEVIAEIATVKRGPNTDSLNLAYYRQGGAHFTEKGLDLLAQKWVEKIEQNSK
ncbi:MAG: hypothetical protein EOP00_04935 [Pedobacter sp.]|nr:MAG: hypothetical protein EOP00_04935 [Pedobacter sp.]